MNDNPKKTYDESMRCNRCGFCQPTCPIYTITRREDSVARGRIILCREVMEGRLALSRELYHPLFECLLCRACTEACFPSVKTDHIVSESRAAYVERFGQPAILRFIFDQLLPSHRRMSHFMRFFRLGKNSGLSGLVRIARILGIYGKQLIRADELLERVPEVFLRELTDSLPLLPQHRRYRIGYFVGCAMNFAMPEVSVATINVLSRCGCEIMILDNCCCGLPAYSYGDIEAVKRVARLNLDSISLDGLDAIVTDCGSCSSFLKDYAELLVDDPYAHRAQDFARKVKDFTELLSAIDRPETASDLGLSVTYHDPCHLSRYQHIKEQPRSLIASLPAVDYLEMAEADWCCGGAGSYNISHFELSEKVLTRKMANVERTGAQVLATSCPSCIVQLKFGVKRYRLPTEVVHVSQLLDRAYQAEKEKND